MNEHRRQILQMLSEGKISADEAERLIAAMEAPASPHRLTLDHLGQGSRVPNICASWLIPKKTVATRAQPRSTSVSPCSYCARVCAWPD